MSVYIHDLQNGKVTLFYKGVQLKGTHIIKFDAEKLLPGEYIAELVTRYYSSKTVMYEL